MLNTPVLFIIFNRKETTEKVFMEIRKIKPRKLFIAADGARANIPGEKEKCDFLRNFIIKNIDWKCEVKTSFRSHNLGCGMGVKSSIDWFFENVEEGIILEDDCLPSQDFFVFCQELLSYYRHDNRISCISGDNFQFGREYGNYSYYFSRYPNTWGWATWRRAWKMFDFDMNSFPEFKRDKVIEQLFTQKQIQKRWMDLFQKVYNKDSNFSVWDIQWTYANFVNNTLSIIPQKNMISNIGLQGTHEMVKQIINMSTGRIGVIKHPNMIFINKKGDEKTFHITIANKNIFVRIFNKIKRYISYKRKDKC